MTFISRKLWRTLRDKAGVPRGFVKGVDVGPILDEATNLSSKSLEDKLKKWKEYEEKFQKYHKALSDSKDKKCKEFAPIFKKQMLDPLVVSIKSAEGMLNAGPSLKENFTNIINDGNKLNNDLSAKDYEEFWKSNPVRLVNMNGKNYLQTDPTFKSHLEQWTKVLSDVMPKNVDNTPEARYKAVQDIIAKAQTLITKIK